MRVPIYTDLPPRRKQVVNMAAAGLALVTLALVVSGFIGGPDPIRRASKDAPKPRALSSVPGEELDSKDAWIGNAGRDLARMRDDLRKTNEEARQRRAEQERINRELLDQMKALREGHPLAAREPAASASGAEEGPSAEDVRRTMSNAAANAGRRIEPGASSAAAATATTFPSQPRGSGGRLPAPHDGQAYPPGSPNRYAGLPSMPAGTSLAAGTAAASPAAGLVRVAVKASSDEGAPSTSSGGARRRLGSFLPVGFAKATILGGLAAPTGGQAQSNPVPVLLRLADAAVLPNDFRAGVRECFVVGEGYGDQSAERAYIRSTLLSCVLRSGDVLEVPLKGSVFGEDGMNGVRGTLVTKQGAILTNALLSGIAAGIGQGVAQASQTVSTSPLGSISTGPTDTQGILKQGLGSGVGKALDRLSQYYIQLAERTFPVIEVQAGRTVDLVITQGAALDPPIAAGEGMAARTRAEDRTTLLRAVREDDHD